MKINFKSRVRPKEAVEKELAAEKNRPEVLKILNDELSKDCFVFDKPISKELEKI